MTTLDKVQTGISGEFFVAAELARRSYDVSITLGNTKAIDLFAQKEDKSFSIQVKAIQRKKSITFNVAREKIKINCFYVFVNLNADTLEAPEYFIMTSDEVSKHIKPAESGRDWIDLNYLKKNGFQDRWEIIV